VDAIYLLEALVGLRFSVEEKNRIRRNLEGFRPITVSKNKAGAEDFFKLVMSFPNPKPRNIEKDVKVFPWKIFGTALKKIIGKYVSVFPEDEEFELYTLISAADPYLLIVRQLRSTSKREHGTAPNAYSYPAAISPSRTLYNSCSTYACAISAGLVVGPVPPIPNKQVCTTPRQAGIFP
jgi:hypothetical protein